MENTNPSFLTPKNYLAHPDTLRFRTLAESRQHRSPKMRQICQDLATHGTSTRRSIMSRVNPHLSPDSNRCYFRRMHTDQTHDSGGRVYHDEATYSVLLNGLVTVSGKTSNGRLLYSLTPEGLRFATAS